MKRSFLICFIPVFCLILDAPLQADSDQADCGPGKGYLKRDILLKDTVIIYDEKGRRVGTMKQDVLFKDRTNIYDQSGAHRAVSCSPVRLTCCSCPSPAHRRSLLQQPDPRPARNQTIFL